MPTTLRTTTQTTTNLAILRGVISADATVAQLADGRSVHNFDLRADGDGVPVAWYDARRPPKLEAGAEVVVVGRVRRRWFRAGGGSQSRTEVVADTVVAARSVRADRVVEAALESARSRPAAEG